MSNKRQTLAGRVGFAAWNGQPLDWPRYNVCIDVASKADNVHLPELCEAMRLIGQLSAMASIWAAVWRLTGEAGAFVAAVEN